jgi:hypothetical protein
VARGQPHVRSLPMGQWKNPRRGDRPRRGLFKEFVTDLEPRVRRRGAEPCSAGIDQAVPQRRASRRDQLSRARQRAEASQSESTSLKSKQVRPSVRVGQARRRERHRSPQKAKWRRGGAQAKRVDEAKQRRSQVREAKPSQRSQAKSEKPRGSGVQPGEVKVGGLGRGQAKVKARNGPLACRFVIASASSPLCESRAVFPSYRNCLSCGRPQAHE